MGLLNPMARMLEMLEMPTGPALLDILPRLADALSGNGPALVPVAAGDHDGLAALAVAFAAGTPLGHPEDDPDDPTAIVVATSGSTGIPKGALLSRSALAASAAATGQRLGPPGTWLLTLPAEHIAGLQVLLRSIATGTVPGILDTRPPFTPERFTEAAERLPSGPRYVSLVPTQLHRILGNDHATAALRTFEAVLVGGAATPTSLQQRAGAAGIRLVTSYGMSETCGGCVYDGVPLSGVDAAIDPSGRVLLFGAVLARGYRNQPGHLAFGEEGSRRSFRTDDLAEWAHGRLRILGRVDDVLITGGLKVAPARLEAAIAALPAVAEVVAVGIPDIQWGRRLVAVIVVAKDVSAPSLEQIRAACTAVGIAAAVQPKQVVVTAGIPMRGPGKPDRQAAVALATAQGTWTPTSGRDLDH